MVEKIMLTPSYMLSKVGEDHVLLPCDESGGVDLTEIIVLNETAYDIVSFIEKRSSTRDEIFDHLYRMYDISKEELYADIDEFISELDKHKALVR